MDALSSWEEQLQRTESAVAREKALRDEINQWVQAYSPDIIVYPTDKAIRAVYETLEFIVGRNAMMRAIQEGVKKILGDFDSGEDEIGNV